MSSDFSPFISLLTNTLKKVMHTSEEMQRICELNAGGLKTDLNPLKLIKTICKLESSFGQNSLPRFEPAYYPGGLYFRKSNMLKNGFDAWGPLVSWSYGPFQLLWVKAAELGYPLQASPLDLWSGYISCPYACEVLNDLFSKGIKSLEQVLACYNGGCGALTKPTNGTKRYVETGVDIYNRL